MIFDALDEPDTGDSNRAGGFPALPVLTINRNHVIETIAQIATSEFPVVFVEGEDGCGATTLLAQFCLAVSEPCFHLFVRPHSRFAYSVLYLRLILAEQFCRYLGRELTTDTAVEESEYQALLLEVRKRKGRRRLFFIIDGIHQIAKDDRRQVAQIFQHVLPLGVDGFRFLITGRQESFDEHLSAVRSKTYPVQRFSEEEGRQFLADLLLDGTSLSELLLLCRGLPGRLASVRRQLLAGTSMQALLAADSKNYPQFLAMEMQTIDELDPVERNILAVIAFSRYALSRKDALKLCDATEGHAERISRLCAFVALRDEPPYSTFESETHRRIAENRLESLRNIALGLQISHLSENPGSLEALQFLPAYLQQANQLQAIVDMVGPDHYERLLDRTQSVSLLRARAALAAKSAHELKLAVQVFQFSLQRSIFFDVAVSRGYQAQVSALVALGHPGNALEVASRAPTKEQRLQMLAEYARRMRESGAELDKDIVSTIRQLSQGDDAFGSPAEAEKLAENVAFVDPDLAISILDRRTSAGGDAEARDRALVNVSIAASFSAAENNGAIVEKTSSQISNERLRSLIAFIANYFGDVTAPQISAIAEPMAVERRTYFLRSILGSGRGRKASLDILEYALDQLVSETSYLPSFKDFVDFATPLGDPSNDPVRTRQLVDKIEKQISLLEEAATSGDRMRLQVKLARGETLYDTAAARKRLVDCYLQVLEISSHEIKVECLAVLLHALREIDASGDIEREEHISEVVRDDLLISINELLAKTASHFEVVRGTLSAVSKYDISVALDVSDRLNTQVARDAAYRHIVITSVGLDKNSVDEKSMLAAVERISDAEIRDDCIVKAIEAATRSSTAEQWFDVLWRLACSTSTVSGTCAAITGLLAIDGIDLSKLKEEFVQRIQMTLGGIVSEVERIDVLFRFSAALAKLDPHLAMDFYKQAEEARSLSRIATGASQVTMGHVMSLLVRAARPLLKFDEFNDDYLARFVRLCGLLPDLYARAAHLADLAAKAWCEQHLDFARRIVQLHCRPLLEGIDKESEVYKNLAAIIFVPLYLARGSVAFEFVDGLTKSSRDDALYSTCLTIVRRATAADPWTGDHDSTCITLEDAEDIVQLIERMRSDTQIWSAIKVLTEALLSPRSRQKIAGHQRVALRHKLEAVVSAHLPDLDNIKHDGYSIVCRAHIARLSENGPGFWNELKESAARLENLADKVLVFIEIATCLPAKMAADRRDIFDRCYREVALIPSAYDRFGRLNHLIECARDAEPGTARNALKTAFDVTFELDNEGAAAKSRRDLLDVAEQIDPKLVDTLIDAIDDDPARVRAKAEAKGQSKVQKARRRIADARSTSDVADRSEAVLPSAAWKNVGALVAGRAVPLVPDRLVEYVAASGEWDLHNAFPVLSWYIENLGRRVMRSDDVVAKVAPIWEALLLSAELAINVISKNGCRQGRLSFDLQGAASGILLGRADGKEGALEFLRSWLRDHGGGGASILLCDPYFGTGDMEFVRIVFGECPHQKITVLTSKKSLGQSTAEDFVRVWSDMVDVDPPDLEIIAMSDPGDDRSPVHDRWLLSEAAGLRLGTSIGGFGGRLSEISQLDSGRFSEVRNLLSPYLGRERVVDGRRVNYVSFNL